MRLTWGAIMFGLGASTAMFAIATPYRYGAWLDPGATMSLGAFSLNIGTGLLASVRPGGERGQSPK